VQYEYLLSRRWKREFEESESVAIESLPILGQSAATVQPNDRTFDDPELPPGAEIKTFEPRHYPQAPRAFAINGGVMTSPMRLADCEGLLSVVSMERPESGKGGTWSLAIKLDLRRVSTLRSMEDRYARLSR